MLYVPLDVDVVDIVVMGPMIIQVIRGIFFLMLSADMIDMVAIVVVACGLIDSIHSLWNHSYCCC